MANNALLAVQFRPVNEVVKKIARRKTKEDWLKYEEEIRDLHACGTTRENIVRILSRDFSFDIT
jgi:hypothetical protein